MLTIIQQSRIKTLNGQLVGLRAVGKEKV